LNEGKGPLTPTHSPGERGKLLAFAQPVPSPGGEGVYSLFPIRCSPLPLLRGLSNSFSINTALVPIIRAVTDDPADRAEHDGRGLVVYMQGHALTHRQLQRTIPVQIQANAILQMNLVELQQFVETEAVENPALCVEERGRCPVCGFMCGGSVCPVCGSSPGKLPSTEKREWSEREFLNTAFASLDDSSFDPFRTVAGASTLTDYLKQQARMTLSGRRLRVAEYLIESLDDDGYFRESLYETAEEFATAVPEIEEVLSIVQRFDPAGIAAKDLRECLLIQLQRLDHTDDRAPLAERILAEHWADFSRMKLKSIAQTLKISPEAVREACEFVKDCLNPRPSSAYRAPFEDLSPRDAAAIAPDVVVHRRDHGFVAEVVDWHGSALKLDETYESVYSSAKSGTSHLSEDDLRHVREHAERVKLIIEAVHLRKSTLARVANFLVEYQKDFIDQGPSHLRPLKQKEVAAELKVHESTICRALAGKSCRLPSGEVISFEVFFDAAMPVREMITQLIARSTEPLSDGEIARKLAEQGVMIARRTVAKYRQQLNVLPYQLRAA